MTRSMRCTWDIIYDILNIVGKNEGIKKTRIVQGAYLDYNSFKKYLKMLVEQGFLYEDKNARQYSTTEQGRSLLGKLNDVYQELPTEVRYEYFREYATSKGNKAYR